MLFSNHSLDSQGLELKPWKDKGRLSGAPNWQGMASGIEDFQHRHAYTQAMNDITREELSQHLSAIEDRMDKRVDRMRDETDRRSDTFIRELELRDEAFRREQAIREKALDDRYASFLIAQAERDKRLDESVSAIRTEIGRLGSIKLNVWGAMLTAVGIGIAIAALATTFYQTGRGDAPKSPAIVAPAQQAEAPAPAPPATPQQ